MSGLFGSVSRVLTSRGLDLWTFWALYVSPSTIHGHQGSVRMDVRTTHTFVLSQGTINVSKIFICAINPS